MAYDPAENVHEDGILRRSVVPAPLTSTRKVEAVAAAGRILTSLDYVGVIGVELFETADGLVVNEIAPRVHNTGHWTLDACVVDQFEQHIRAICGWPLGDGARHADAVMDQPDRGRGRGLAPPRRRSGAAAASLRQGRGPAGAQDGARDAADAPELRRRRRGPGLPAGAGQGAGWGARRGSCLEAGADGPRRGHAASP